MAIAEVPYFLRWSLTTIWDPKTIPTGRIALPEMPQRYPMKTKQPMIPGLLQIRTCYGQKGLQIVRISIERGKKGDFQIRRHAGKNPSKKSSDRSPRRLSILRKQRKDQAVTNPLGGQLLQGFRKRRSAVTHAKDDGNGNLLLDLRHKAAADYLKRKAFLGPNPPIRLGYTWNSTGQDPSINQSRPHRPRKIQDHWIH